MATPPSATCLVHPRAHLDDAALRRRLDGVQQHVEEHLIDFAGMTQDRRQLGEGGPQIDRVLLDLVDDDLQGGLQVRR